MGGGGVGLVGHPSIFRIRTLIGATSRAVSLTARQTIHNLAGFKARKEAATKTTFSASDIAGFWKANVSGRGELTSTSAVDACLTIHKRLFLTISKFKQCD